MFFTLIAQTVKITLPNPVGEADFWTVLNKVYDYLLYLAIPLAILLIILSGVEMMRAKDNAANFAAAAKRLKWVVIGLFILLAAPYLPLVVKGIISLKDKY